MMWIVLHVSNTKAWNYHVLTAKQNKDFDKLTVTELDSRSVIECAVQCANNCQFFGFNFIINRCRVYKDCDIRVSVAADNEWIIFQVRSPPSLSLLFYHCSIKWKIWIVYKNSILLYTLSIHIRKKYEALLFSSQCYFFV